MVFSDQVISSSGPPDIWITEDLEDDPDGDIAPYSIRVVWKVVRMNMGLVTVYASAVHRIQDGAKSGRTHSIPESVPDEHLKEMRSQMQLDVAGKKHDQKIRFPQWDLEHTVAGKDSRGGS